MSPASRPGAGSPRRGLVLGGGGVLGAAWATGALHALEQVEGFDPRTADIIVGTSAGSVLAALLGAGLSTDDLLTHQMTGHLDSGPLSDQRWDYDSATGGARPQLPTLSPGSLALFARNVTRLHRLPPTAVLSAFVPKGRGDLTAVHRLVDSVTDEGGWCRRDGIWVVAMDYLTGRRAVFGHPDGPQAPLPEAVQASCAIPGWYPPVEIEGRPYVDGGAWSATSVDLLAGLDLDEVYVVAPMVSFATDHPAHLFTRLERRWRVQVTRRCLHEARKVRDSGSHVTILGPGPADLEGIGGNVMDAARRRRVLQTSLRTSVEALQHPRPDNLDVAI